MADVASGQGREGEHRDLMLMLYRQRSHFENSELPELRIFHSRAVLNQLATRK